MLVELDGYHGVSHTTVQILSISMSTITTGNIDHFIMNKWSETSIVNCVYGYDLSQSTSYYNIVFRWAQGYLFNIFKYT